MDEMYAKLLESSIRFVSFRPRSEKEFKDFLLKKLQKRKIPNGSIIDRVIFRLRELGYIDDAKFASWWVEQRESHKPKGARLIAWELKAKGISLETDTRDEVSSARRAIAEVRRKRPGSIETTEQEEIIALYERKKKGG